MKVIISAGGTGGHIYPALAIIDKILEKEINSEIVYIGTHNRMEKNIVKKRGYRYVGLEIYGLSKTNMIRNLKNVFLVNRAEKKCMQVMKEFKPDIVIGTGGYVIFPVLKAAKKLGIKTFIHEQNSMAGKSNKWISEGVDLVGVSFESTIKQFEKAKEVLLTGNPCGAQALKSKEITKKELHLNSKKKMVLVVCGSLGSKTINNKFLPVLKLMIKEEYSIVYLTGKNNYDEFMSNGPFPKNVVVMPEHENLSGLMKSADLIVTRAGASTLCEIMALKKPALIIPSPYVANNHQYYNALDFVNLGVAKVLEEKNLTVEKLILSIDDMLNPKNLKLIEKNYKNLKQIDSAEVIYNKIKEII